MKKKVLRKKKSKVTVIKNNRLMKCGHPFPSEAEMKLEIREMLDNIYWLVSHNIEEALRKDMAIQNQVEYILDAMLGFSGEGGPFSLTENCILDAAERVKTKRDNDKKE